MAALLKRFARDRSGATAIEYGLIIAVLSLAIVVGVTIFADALRLLWSGNDSKVVEVFGRSLN